MKHTVATMLAATVFAFSASSAIAADGACAPLQDLGISRITTVQPGSNGALFEKHPRVLELAGNANDSSLKVGDKLISINRHDLTKRGAVEGYAALSAGEEVKVTVKRGDTYRTKTVVLGERCNAT